MLALLPSYRRNEYTAGPAKEAACSTKRKKIAKQRIVRGSRLQLTSNRGKISHKFVLARREGSTRLSPTFTSETLHNKAFTIYHSRTSDQPEASGKEARRNIHTKECTYGNNREAGFGVEEDEKSRRPRKGAICFGKTFPRLP